MTKQIILNIEDLIVLKAITESNPLKNDFATTVKRSKFSPYHRDRYINFQEIIPKLLSLGLIRENVPMEWVNFITNYSLKSLLKNHNIKSNVSKEGLIDLVSTNLSTEEIVSNPSYNVFYVVSDSGKETLEKYKNLFWFLKNQEKIFGYNNLHPKFNDKYFFDYYDKDPLTEMINYFENKDPEITGKLYAWKKKYGKALNYAAQLYTNRLTELIETSIKDRFYTKDCIEYRIAERNSNWIVSSYIDSDDSEKQDLLQNIETIYKNDFGYKECIPMSLFQEVLLVLIQENSYSYSNIESKLYSKLKESYPEEDTYQKYMEEKVSNEVALLDLLIKHLDVELLKELKGRIDLRISEIDE